MHEISYSYITSETTTSASSARCLCLRLVFYGPTHTHTGTHATALIRIDRSMRRAWPAIINCVCLCCVVSQFLSESFEPIRLLLANGGRDVTALQPTSDCIGLTSSCPGSANKQKEVIVCECVEQRVEMHSSARVHKCKRLTKQYQRRTGHWLSSKGVSSAHKQSEGQNHHHLEPLSAYDIVYYRR